LESFKFKDFNTTISKVDKVSGEHNRQRDCAI